MARMDNLSRLAMLATIGGTLALLLGLAVLMLPLLVSELSRPRDSVWGALVLMLGLVLVTSAERLRGEPMLAVLLGGLLLGRLGREVAQARWFQLTLEERQYLASAERWRTSFDQLGATIAAVLEGAAAVVASLSAWIAARRKTPAITKRWVRPESATEKTSTEPAAPTALKSTTLADTPTLDAAPTAAALSDAALSNAPTDPEAEPMASAGKPDEEEMIVVSGFDEIDALLRATEASQEEPPAAQNNGPEAG